MKKTDSGRSDRDTLFSDKLILIPLWVFKQPMNPLWERIYWFFWLTTIWTILDHWSWSSSSQTDATTVSPHDPENSLSNISWRRTQSIFFSVSRSFVKICLVHSISLFTGQGCVSTRQETRYVLFLPRMVTATIWTHLMNQCGKNDHLWYFKSFHTAKRNLSHISLVEITRGVDYETCNFLYSHSKSKTLVAFDGPSSRFPYFEEQFIQIELE